MLDQHRKGDASRRWRPRFVRCEADEPRVRGLARHFGGAGLAGDAQRMRPQDPAGTVEHAVAHVARERSRRLRRQQPLALDRQIGAQFETRLGEHAAVGQGSRHARHAQRACQHVTLPVGRLRQRGAEALDGSAGRHRDAERRRRVEQRLGAQLEGQLREVGVARHHQPVVHADPAVRMPIQHVVADRPAAGDAGADTPVGQGTAAVGLGAQRGILSQRGGGRHQLEGRARRIQAEAGAVEERLGPILGAGPDRTVHHRKRIARQRQDVTGRSIEHRGRGVAGLGPRGGALENLRDTQLQPRVEGGPHVALPGYQCGHRRMLWLMAVAQHRHELTIVAAHGAHGRAVCRCRRHRHLVVVEPAQPVVGVALDVGAVAGAPVVARVGVAQHVERGAADRVAPAHGFHAGTVGRGAELLVRRSRSPRELRVAGGQHAAGAIEHIAAGQRTYEIHHPRVVLIAGDAVGLHAEVRLDHVLIGAHQLHVEQDTNEDQRRESERAAEIPHRHLERLGAFTAAAVRGNRGEDAEPGEVGHHGRSAVAEERRDHARERDDAEQAAGHQQHRRDQEQRHRRGEEEAVVIGGAHGNAEAAPRDRRIEHGHGQQPNQAQLFADRGQRQIGLPRR